jgi:hypothetical protein
MVPRPATSRSSRITSVRPAIAAVAASKPSMTGIVRVALIRPHISAVALYAQHATLEGRLDQAKPSFARGGLYGILIRDNSMP